MLARTTDPSSSLERIEIILATLGPQSQNMSLNVNKEQKASLLRKLFAIKEAHIKLLRHQRKKKIMFEKSLRRRLNEVSMMAGKSKIVFVVNLKVRKAPTIFQVSNKEK